MARATRSQKVEIVEDNSTYAVRIPLPSTPTQEQRALADIFHGPNSLPVLEDEAALEVKNLKAAYRAALGIGKRTRKVKNKRTEQQELLPAKAAVAREQSTPSQAFGSGPSTSLLLSTEGDAPSEERMQLRATRQQSKLQVEGQFGNEVQFNTQDQLVAQRRADLSYITSLFGGRSTGSPRLFIRPQNFGRSITNDHIALIQEKRAKALEQESRNIERDSSAPHSTRPPTPEISATIDLVESRASKSPSKLRTIEEIEEACAAQLPPSPADGTIVDEEDSFCEQIISRSPAKPVTRIEDSVEALDQLEEALEALDQAALGKTSVSTSTVRNNDALDKSEEQSGPKDRRQNTRKLQGLSSANATVRVKPTAPKQVPSIKRAASVTFGRAGTDFPAAAKGKARQPKAISASYVPQKETVKSTKPLTRPTSFVLPGEAISQKLKGQREARRAQRESSEETQKDPQNMPRILSTKPLTRPTFQLPGEAVSQKKREALEARWKAQEEEEKRRREFKARPLRLSNLPNTIPRDTVASRARQNKTGNENSQEGKLDPSKGTSNIGAHRISMAQLNLANVSAPRAPGLVPLVRKPSNTSSPSSSSVPAHMQRTLSAHDVQIQRQRAKEIYNRDVFQTEDIERERKEREAAAKRAREEAAERGRQASREWAEKQRAKRMAEVDKGLSTGYGPGGQLGLQA